MKIGVLADTHIPKRAKDLPAKAYALLSQCDCIIHAGDILTDSLLQNLRAIAPVYAVLGNNDLDVQLPERLLLSFENVQIAVVHNSGDGKGRGARLRKMFPQANVVVFGHSHIPMNEEHEGLLMFNPGSPTDKRRQPKPTIGVLHVSNGTAHGDIVELD